jgi:CopG family nickel-responsive transcriptional regulator
MASLSRFGVSIDADLLKRFDRFIESTGYRNRSEAFRDLIRARLIEEEVQHASTPGLGVLSLVYDHRTRELEEKLTDLQHHHHASVIAAMHIHIDENNCLEAILLKGRVKTMQHIASSLASLKGVKHSNLALTSTDSTL